MLKFKIDENMAKNTKLSLTDVAVLANISRYRNNNTTAFRLGHVIAEVLNVSARTIDNSVKALKEVGAYTVQKVNVVGTTKFSNKYNFLPLETGFVLIADSIFECGLHADLIGFLIRAKANAYNNGLTLKGNKEKLASMLQISFGKFNKHLKQLEALGLVSYSESVLTITCDFFIDYSKKDEKVELVKILNDELPKDAELPVMFTKYINGSVEVRNARNLVDSYMSGVSKNKTIKQTTQIIL